MTLVWTRPHHPLLAIPIALNHAQDESERRERERKRDEYGAQRLSWTSVPSCITTGFWYFAESPSARQRATTLSAKPLPRARSATTARHSLNRQRQSLPRATWQALGKGFAESHVSTQQRLTAVAREALVDGSLPSATMVGARQKLFIFF